MLFFVLLNFSMASQVIKTIETTSTGEVLTYNKYMEGECVKEGNTSKKFVMIKSLPFMLYYNSNNCKGARVGIEEIDPLKVSTIIPRAIARLRPKKGPDKSDVVFLTSACSLKETGSVKYQFINNSLIPFNYVTNDCSGSYTLGSSVKCNETVSTYVLLCSSSTLTLTTLILFLFIVI